MANLAKGGRAGVVIPEGVLFRSGPDAKVRKKLLEEFNVHTIKALKEGHPKFARKGLKPLKEKLGEGPDQKLPLDWGPQAVLPGHLMPK